MALTLFALSPIQVITPDEGEPFDAPSAPPSWALTREGDTGWFELRAPGAQPAVARRMMLFDCTRLGFPRIPAGPNTLALYQAQAQDRAALAFVRPMLAQIPWWATLREIRDPDSATGRNRTWRTRANLIRDAWPDLRPRNEEGNVIPGTGPVIRPYVTIAGFDAVAEADDTDPSEV